MQSLQPWNPAPIYRRKSGIMFGLPIERSSSSMSGIVSASGTLGRGVSVETRSESGLIMEVDPPFTVQRFPSIEHIFRLPSFECIRRMSSIDDIRRMASTDSMQDVSSSTFFDDRCGAPQLQQMDGLSEIDEDEYLSDDSETENDFVDSTTVDQSIDGYAPTPSGSSEVPRRRVRCDPSKNRNDSFDILDQERPWEDESLETLNTFPTGFENDPKDLNLSLGDLRVLARFHVQKVANAKGIKLPAGMTNSDLIALADTLGLFPLMYRLHLEATGKISTSKLHELFLDYKRESKFRAKSNKARRDLDLAAKTRITDDGRITIDYFEGIALRLGRERDTIFRPSLHKIFREFKTQIRPKLAEAGLAYNEVRKWRDTQLCTAIWVANQFVDGIWQAAVDVHLSKTKDFA
jgi:hypothetical protein